MPLAFFYRYARKAVAFSARSSARELIATSRKLTCPALKGRPRVLEPSLDPAVTPRAASYDAAAAVSAALEDAFVWRCGCCFPFPLHQAHLFPRLLTGPYSRSGVVARARLRMTSALWGKAALPDCAGRVGRGC